MLDDPREGVGLERVDGLLFDDDLLCAVDGEPAVAVGHHYAACEQGGFGLVLAGGAGHAVLRPCVKFGIVLGVGVGGGDHRDAVRARRSG